MFIVAALQGHVLVVLFIPRAKKTHNIKKYPELGLSDLHAGDPIQFFMWVFLMCAFRPPPLSTAMQHIAVANV